MNIILLFENKGRSISLAKGMKYPIFNDSFVIPLGGDGYTRIKILGLVFIIIFLILGIVIADLANGFLAITFEPKTLEEIPEYESVPYDKALPVIGSVGTIIIPTGANDDDLYNKSATALADAVYIRTESEVSILTADSVIPSGGVFAIGATTRNSFVSTDLEVSLENESFALRSYIDGSYNVVAVIGGDHLGDVYGAYWLADELLTGTELGGGDLFSLNLTVEPEMSFRMVDLGPVGIVEKPDAWGDDYSMSECRFADVVLESYPHVNTTAFERVRDEWEDYVHRIISYGYNTISFETFLEYVNFDLVGDGYQVYAADSIYRERHLALRETFGQLFEYAANMGVKVILQTDMVALSEPLTNYFVTEFGAINTSSPEFWQVYKAGLREALTEIPGVQGVMIRTGEGGQGYAHPGWNYYSELLVTTVSALQIMLNEMLEVIEDLNKTLIYRTWSIGIGDAGDLHTNSDTYERVLSDVSSPNLIVSTKFTQGDFYSYLPFNPTFEAGNHQRIIELQCRREYEGMGAIPDYVGPLHQEGIQAAAERCDSLVGMWTWTQHGGPIRAGPMNTYSGFGFWLYIDANVYATSKLAWNTYANITAVTEGWVASNFGTDPTLVANMSQMLLKSREPILKVLYIKPFAEKAVYAFGLEPPPMLYIFEWNLVTASTAVWSGIYTTSKDDLQIAINDGFAGLGSVRELQSLVAGLDAYMVRGLEWYDRISDSLQYEESLFETLVWYRAYALWYYHYLETGDSDSRFAYADALVNFRTAVKTHEETYGDNLDFPAYNFEEAEMGIQRAQMNENIGLVAVLTLVLTLIFILLGVSPIQKSLREIYPFKKATRIIWLSLLTPWKLKDTETNFTREGIFTTIIVVLLILLGFGVVTFFMAPWVLIGISTVLVVYVVIAIILFSFKDMQSKGTYVIATLSPLLLVNIILSGIISIRGPSFFFFLFWVDPAFRTVLLATIMGVVGWLLFGFFLIIVDSLEIRKIVVLGRFIILTGVLLVVIGGVITLLGFETVVAAANRELLLLPFGMAIYLEITTQLGLSGSLPLEIALAGLALIILGIVLNIIDNIIQREVST
jgi:hypothetical protein